MWQVGSRDLEVQEFPRVGIHPIRCSQSTFSSFQNDTNPFSGKFSICSHNIHIIQTLYTYHLLAFYLLRLVIMFARAATPSLCRPSLFTQMALLPSTTATISSAILVANMLFPLPLLFLFDAASKIQLMAVQRLRRRLSGIGRAKATPPPAAPRC